MNNHKKLKKGTYPWNPTSGGGSENITLTRLSSEVIFMNTLEKVQDNKGGIKALLMSSGMLMITLGTGLVSQGKYYEGIGVALVGLGAIYLREIVKVQ